jgi:hypothetical protein
LQNQFLRERCLHFPNLLHTILQQSQHLHILWVLLTYPHCI